jgi:hypothetical protein
MARSKIGDIIEISAGVAPPTSPSAEHAGAMNKTLPIAAWFACILSLCFALLSVWVSLLMWPGVFLQNVGSFVILSVAHLLSFFQLWAVLKKKFAVALSLFAIAIASFLLMFLIRVDIGPSVCAWGPYQGLIDCGLPTAVRETRR